jgi:serine/threonine protein kinase
MTDLHRIDDGPVATVYSGHRAGVPVALKVFPKRFDKRTLSAFNKEQAKLSGVRRITSLLMVDGVEDLPTGESALRMELCTQSLAGLIERAGPLAAADVAVLGRAMAVALAAAHGVGVVHGGVSPSNVLFRENGEPVVGDFGVTLRQAFTRDPLHAIEYLPPETLRTGALDELTDLYGLGAVLHFALTGRSPHPGRLGEQPGERVLRILGEPVPAINRDDVPLGLSTLVARLLATVPEHRPQEAVQVAEHLTAMLPDSPTPQTEDWDDFDSPVAQTPPVVPVGPPDFDDFAVRPWDAGGVHVEPVRWAPMPPPPEVAPDPVWSPSAEPVAGLSAGSPAPVSVPPASVPDAWVPPAWVPAASVPAASVPAVDSEPTPSGHQATQQPPQSEPPPPESSTPQAPSPPAGPSEPVSPDSSPPAAPSPPALEDLPAIGIVLNGHSNHLASPAGDGLADDFAGRPTVLAGPLERPDRPARRLTRYDVLAGAAIVLALLALVPLLLLRGDPEEISSIPRVPTANGVETDAVTVELAAPTDLRSTVRLTWKATRDLDFAVVIAAEGQKTRVLLAERERSMTVDVEPERKYCFLVQASDGDQVYESAPQPLRGAVCRK